MSVDQNTADRLMALGRFDMLDIITEAQESPEVPEEPDMVQAPSHYQLSDDLEAKDVIRMVLGEDGWKAYCKGSMLKYLLRKKWNADEDVAKAGRFSEMYSEESK